MFSTDGLALPQVMPGIITYTCNATGPWKKNECGFLHHTYIMHNARSHICFQVDLLCLQLIYRIA